MYHFASFDHVRPLIVHWFIWVRGKQPAKSRFFARGTNIAFGEEACICATSPSACDKRAGEIIYASMLALAQAAAKQRRAAR